MEDFSSVHWLAVFVGTIVSFISGQIWYSPKVFGQAWAVGVGITLDAKAKPPVFAMLAQITALFILATVIGITATTDALFTAILSILYVAVFVVSSGSFENKNLKAFTIEGAYIVVSGGYHDYLPGYFIRSLWKDGRICLRVLYIAYFGIDRWLRDR